MLLLNLLQRWGRTERANCEIVESTHTQLSIKFQFLFLSAFSLNRLVYAMAGGRCDAIDSLEALACIKINERVRQKKTASKRKNQLKDGRREKKRDFDLIYFFFLVFVHESSIICSSRAHKSFSVYAEEMIDTSNNSRDFESNINKLPSTMEIIFILFFLLHTLQVISVFEF